MSASDYLTTKKVKSLNSLAKYTTRDASSRVEVQRITTIINGTSKNEFGINPETTWFNVPFLPQTSIIECETLWECNEPTTAPSIYNVPILSNPPPMSVYPSLKIIKQYYPSCSGQPKDIKGFYSINYTY